MICSSCGKEKKTASQMKTCRKCRHRKRKQKKITKELNNNKELKGAFQILSPEIEQPALLPDQNFEVRHHIDDNISDNSRDKEGDNSRIENLVSERTVGWNFRAKNENMLMDSQATIAADSSSNDSSNEYDVESENFKTEVLAHISADNNMYNNMIDIDSQPNIANVNEVGNESDNNIEMEEMQEYEEMQENENENNLDYENIQTAEEPDKAVKELVNRNRRNSISPPPRTETGTYTEHLSPEDEEKAIEELLAVNGYRFDNWAKIVVKSNTGSILDIHRSNKWYIELNSTTRVLKNESTRLRILKIIGDKNYTGVRSGFLTRPIQHATLYALKHCPDCSMLSKRLHHVKHFKPSTKEVCSNRCHFVTVQGHKISLSYIKIISSHEFPDIPSSIVNKLNKPQLTRELTEYILGGNKYLEDVNFKENILDKYRKDFGSLLLQLSQESETVHELRQALVDRMGKISEFAKKDHQVGHSLFRKFRNVRQQTVTMYTNIVFKILYTMFKLQELGYFKLQNIDENIESIDSIEVITNYVDNHLIFTKINPVGFKFVSSPFIVALWINHLEPVNFSLRDESGIQHLFDATQFVMKLELINYCHENQKNLEKEYKARFKASEDYTTVYKLLKIMKCKLFEFRTIASNYYDVFFTRKYSTMLYRDTEIHLSDIPEFVIFLVRRFCNTLTPILSPGFNLLDFIEENYDLEFYSATSCFMPLHAYRTQLPFVNFDSPDNLKKALCFNFFKLNKIIILMMYFTGGLPFRMTEVLVLQFNDVKRNIFFRGGKMLCTYTYNKTDNVSNKSKLISRGYPIIVSKVVFFYINYIRYYELKVMEQLKQIDRNKEKWEKLQERCTRYLFVDIGSGIVQQEDMYALFMSMSTIFFKKRLGIRDWRQIMVQFVKKNVSSTSKLSSTFIYKFLEMQAGHGPVVALNSYEKTNSREYDNSIVEAQQMMSERWHDIINLPSSIREIEDFEPKVQFEPKEIF